MVHQKEEIRYFQAKNVDDVRAADNKMVSKVSQIERMKADRPINIKQAKLIKAKILAENFGLPRTAFAEYGPDKGATKDDIDEVGRRLKNLEMQGYGEEEPKPAKKKKRLPPGVDLKRKLIQKIREKEHSEASKSAASAAASNLGPLLRALQL